MVNHTDTNPPKKSWIRTLISIALPILVIVGFFILTQIIVAMNAKPEEKRTPFTPLAVLAEIAVQDDVQLVVKTQGEARPRTEIDLVPQVSGKIIYVSPKFVDGGIFKKGETLYRIDPSDYNVAVTRAEAAVARAQQLLVREKAEADVAASDWEEIGTGDPSDLTLRKPQMAEASANLQSAEADLQNAKLQLSRSYVRAPFDGRVRTKFSDIGQFVSPGTPLGRIFSTDIAEVRLPLTDDDLSKINLPIAYVAESRASAPVVKLSTQIAGVQQHWTGYIMRTDSSYDTQTRALFAIAEVFDPYGEGASDTGVPLAPGLFLNAEVKGKSFEDIVVLPRDGLRPENVVYIGQPDGSATKVKAKVLDTTMNYAYITSGVAPGDIVILSPVEESRLGGPLKVLDINNTDTVLIDPPKPKWLEEKEKAQDEGEQGAKNKKGMRKGEQDDVDAPASENADETNTDEASSDGSVSNDGGDRASTKNSGVDE